jgi:hypothetical protein
LSITAQTIVAEILVLLVSAALMLAWSLCGRIVRLTKRAGTFADIINPGRQDAATAGKQGGAANALLDALTILKSTFSNAMKVISPFEIRLVTAAAAQVSMPGQRPVLNIEPLKMNSLKSLVDSCSALDSLSGSAEDAAPIPDTHQYANQFQGQPDVTGCLTTDKPGELKLAFIYDIAAGLQRDYGLPPSNGQPVTDVNSNGAEHEIPRGGSRACPPGQGSLIPLFETKSFVGSETSRDEVAVLGLHDAAGKGALLLQRVDSAQAALIQLNLTISQISPEGSGSSNSADAQSRVELGRDSGIGSDGLTTSQAEAVMVTRSATGKLSQVAANLAGWLRVFLCEAPR